MPPPTPHTDPSPRPPHAPDPPPPRSAPAPTASTTHQARDTTPSAHRGAPPPRPHRRPPPPPTTPALPPPAPPPQHQITLTDIQQRHLAHHHRGIGGHRLDHPPKPGHQPLDAGPVKQIRGIRHHPGGHRRARIL